MAGLGRSLSGQKRYSEAEPLLLAGYQGMSQREATIPAASRPAYARISDWLAQLYTDQGKPELALRWKKASLTVGPDAR